jgi:hypothetical protein
MRRAALPASGLYPLAVLSLTVFAYASSAMLHGSGFASVYVAALILGNSELPHRAATRSFAEGMAWLAQIGLFVMLGLLVSPSRITWEHVGLAVAAGLVLTYVARPLSVMVAAAVQPLPWRELADRPRHDPAVGAREGRDQALRHRLRDGGDLHRPDRPDPATRGAGPQGRAPQRAARARGGGGPPGTDRGGPAHGHDLAEVADARGRGR